MPVRRYRIVKDPGWEVWVEGQGDRWWVRCPCHLGPTGYFRDKATATRAARLHRRGRQAGSSAGGGR